MAVDLKAAILGSIDELKKAISKKSSEMAQLQNELKQCLHCLRDATAQTPEPSGVAAQAGLISEWYYPGFPIPLRAKNLLKRRHAQRKSRFTSAKLSRDGLEKGRSRDWKEESTKN